jgi:uncharacterized protein (TIGR03437 family)
MQLRSVLSILLTVVLLWTPAALAREPEAICGTDRIAAREDLFLHRRSTVLRNKSGLLRAATGPVGKDFGDIAVMYDSGGVVARRNPFNLSGRSLTFTPTANTASRYRFETAAGSAYDEAAANNGGVLSNLNDDDTRRVPLTFAFPFFGRTWSDLWVNSDGNVTFGQGDNASTNKTIGLLTGGPPRIAPLFVDLDPSRSLRGVRVLTEATRAVITWLEVPLFGGSRALQTVQLTLFPDGRMRFSYETASPTDAVTGISPGGSQGSTEIVAFLEPNTTEFTASVAERFTNSEALDTVLLTQRFYETHDDAYDYVAVYNTLDISARAFAVATELTLRSRFRAGFGDFEVNIGEQYGSKRRLQAFLNMGPLSTYPRDPNAEVRARVPSGDTPLTVLLHETGHLFLALASVRDEVDPVSRPMLGSALAHWSFNFNSEASFLEGNRIQDNGENANPRFATTATVEQYSPLDQYLMGFRAPEEVPPTYLVTGSGRFNDSAPQRGVTFNGQRRNVTVDELIEAEGRRAPDHTVAQRRFRMAIILLVREGTEPSADDLAQLDTLRSAFEATYARTTENRASIETGLRRNLELSIAPNAGMLAGSTLTATITLDRPRETPLAVVLKTRNGIASLPASVTIPAGQRSVSFAIEGNEPGVEEITAEPSDAAYITEHARLQVSPPEALQLTIIGGDKQTATPGQALASPIELRLTDHNLIPYPNQTVRAAATGGGSLESATAVTDIDGIARFRWTPGTGGNQLTAAIEGTSATITANALGRPVLLASSVLNAASYAPGLAPGALGVAFGASLAAGRTAQALSLPWPTRLAGVELLLNGTAVPLYYAADGQINFRVPDNTPTGTAELVVVTELGRSEPVRVAVTPTQPGLFFNPTTGEAAALIAGTGLLTSQRAIRRGEILEVYATGLGPLRASAGNPGLFETIDTPQITAGGIALEILFSGQTPGIPGLYQINARLPANVPTGTVPVQIQSGAQQSNAAPITIQP